SFMGRSSACPSAGRTKPPGRPEPRGVPAPTKLRLSPILLALGNHRRAMSRSRPEIDVSAHLIDPSRFAQPGALSWPSVFGNDHPVELEIGSGKGLFLLNAATAEPTHNFLGIEISRKYARLAAERLAKHAIPNAKVWPGDARIVLPRHIPAASL